MNKSQQTWTVVVFGLVIVLIVLALLWKFWQIAMVGGVAFLFGFIFGYRKGKVAGRKQPNQG